MSDIIEKPTLKGSCFSSQFWFDLKDSARKTMDPRGILLSDCPFNAPECCPLLSNTVKEISVNNQADSAMTLLTGLAALSTVIQGLVDVRLPSGQVVPCSLYALVLASSGTRKTTIEAAFNDVIRAFQEKELERFEVELKAWIPEHKIWFEKNLGLMKALRRNASKGLETEGIEDSLRALADSEPAAPRQMRMLYLDATLTALMQGLNKNSPYAALLSSEGGVLLKHLVGNDLAIINSIWSGETIIVDRASTVPFTLNGVRLALLIMSQQNMFDKYAERNGEQARGSGFWARALVYKSAVTPGGRTLFQGDHDNKYINRYRQRIVDLLEEVSARLSNSSCRRDVLEFSQEAATIWGGFYNWVEAQCLPGGKYEHATDHASKLAEIAGRVAAIIHYFEGLSGPIRSSIMRAAIWICEMYSEDFLKVFVPPPPEIQDAEKLLAWLIIRYREGAQSIKKSVLQTSGPVRPAFRLDPALHVLIMRGYLKVRDNDKPVIVCMRGLEKIAFTQEERGERLSAMQKVIRKGANMPRR